MALQRGNFKIDIEAENPLAEQGAIWGDIKAGVKGNNLGLMLKLNDYL
jgi:hypothetical protein